MTDRAFVPRESVAVALGAAEVAGALAQSGAEVTRNGSRGLLWAEPMIELERDGTRTAYGNVEPGDAANLDEHELGPVEELLAGQRRVVFAKRSGLFMPAQQAFQSQAFASRNECSMENSIDRPQIVPQWRSKPFVRIILHKRFIASDGKQHVVAQFMNNRSKHPRPAIIGCAVDDHASPKGEG